MPTPPVQPGVCRFRILGTLANLAPWGVRLYAAYTGVTPASGVMLSLAEAVGSAWNTNCCPHQSEDITTTEIDGVDLSSELGAGATADVDYVGGTTDPAVENQIAAVVKFEISRRYRGGKPKMYFPGAPTSAVEDDSHFTTAYVNALGTAFTSFDAAIGEIAESGTLLSGIVNVSYYKGFTAVENPITGRYRNVPTYRGAGFPTDFINSFTADTLMGSQRRRRIG